jgi:hypothetical protein
LRSLKLPLLLATICLLVNAAGAGVGGNTVWVDDDCIPPGTGTQLDPFCSIDDAWDAATTLAGDTIRVRPGTYNECPTQPIDPVDKPVTLLADAWDLNQTDPTDPADDPDSQLQTIIDGTGVCDSTILPLQPVVLMSNGSFIRGFTIQHAGDSGILVFEGDGTIEFNIVRNNDAGTVGGGGVYIQADSCDQGPSNVIVRTNWIHDNISELDGGGIYAVAGTTGDAVGCPTASNSTILIADNLIENNVALEGNGGGIWAGTKTFVPTVTSSITIEDNVIRENLADSATPAFDFGIGGGIQAVQGASVADGSGAGIENILVQRNLVEENTAFEQGGGIGTEIIANFPINLSITVTDNDVFENTAGGGGGLDIFFSVDTVVGSSAVRTDVTNNDVRSNSALAFGGAGITAFSEVIRSGLVGTTSTVSVSENRILDNVAGGTGGGGGALLIARARNTIGQSDTSAGIVFTDNLVAGNQSTDGYGLGVLAQLSPCQTTTTAIDIDGSTIAGNVEGGDGTNGIEISFGAPSGSACTSSAGPGFGQLLISDSIVANNGSVGVGGFSNANLTVTVRDSTVFGHGDNYEDILEPSLVLENATNDNPGFPAGGAPEDPLSYVPDVCSPVHDLGTEGAGYWESTDANGDGEVDGIDLLDLAVSFGASTGDPRFDPESDLDDDGFVGADDLTAMAVDFGQVCP